MLQLKKRKLKRRHREILETMIRARKEIITTREIAGKLRLHVNGVSQSLSALELKGHVREEPGGNGGDRKWRFMSL